MNIKSLNRLNKINKNIIYKTFNGDHFSYFDYRYEIYILINEFNKGDKYGGDNIFYSIDFLRV